MTRLLIPFLLCMAVSGCMSEDVLHYDGVTTGAGDAIAANSAMQMVDPWPAGVDDTRLRPPLVRPVIAPARPDSDTTVADN